jgi:hypothetical protein
MAKRLTPPTMEPAIAALSPILSPVAAEDVGDGPEVVGSVVVGVVGVVSGVVVGGSVVVAAASGGLTGEGWTPAFAVRGPPCQYLIPSSPARKGMSGTYH